MTPMTPMTPTIFIQTGLFRKIFLKMEGETFYYKEAKQTLHDVLDQIKLNILKYGFISTDETMAHKAIDTIFEEMYHNFLHKKEACFYVREDNILLQINLIGYGDKTGIRICPLAHFGVKGYNNDNDIDTALYVKLALKLAENLVIYSFLAEGF